MATKAELKNDIHSLISDVAGFAATEDKSESERERATFNMLRRMVGAAQGALVTSKGLWDKDGNPVEKDGFSAGMLAALQRTRKMTDKSRASFASTLQTALKAGEGYPKLGNTLDKVFAAGGLYEKVAAKSDVQPMFRAGYAIIREQRKLELGTVITDKAISAAILKKVSTDNRTPTQKAESLLKRLDGYVNGVKDSDGALEEDPIFTGDLWEQALTAVQRAVGAMPKDEKAEKKIAKISSSTKATIVSQALSSMSEAEIMSFIHARNGASK